MKVSKVKKTHQAKSIYTLYTLSFFVPSNIA